MAPQLHADFPRTPLLITGDSLYGCGPAIQIAKDHGFSYSFTFKPGRTPALWKEFQSLLHRVARAYGQAPRTLFGALKNIPRRLPEAFRCYPLPETAFAPTTPLRIHLDST